MTALRYAVADTLVLAKRSLLRIPRAPDLLLAFTVQPVMFVLLFAYVFGGAIETPGYSYIDFLMPGIIVQTMAFGGFVTALGLAEDLKKGLIDRFRSLPMSRAAVLAGPHARRRRHQLISIAVMLVVGVIAGFRFRRAVLDIVAGIVLLLLFGYAFSWVFAFIGLTASSPEAAQVARLHRHLPAHLRLLGLRPGRSMPAAPGRSPKSTPSRSSSTPCAPSSSAPPPATTSGAPSPGPSASPPSSPPSPCAATNAP